MRRRPPRRQAGWSLIELMAALAAFIPMMLGLLYLFRGAMEIFVAGTNRLEMVQYERATIDLIAQHLRPAVYMDNSVPVDNNDVGTGRNFFGFRGDADATSSFGRPDDFLGWYYLGFDNNEENADGGEIQYAQVHVARYIAMAGYSDRRALKFLTGNGSGNTFQKSSDANPYPRTGLPPSPPGTADASPNNASSNTRVIDDLYLLDFDFTDDTPTPPGGWVENWNAATEGHLPKYVRLSVRIETPDPADSFAISTIVHLPLWEATSPWPGGIRP